VVGKKEGRQAKEKERETRKGERRSQKRTLQLGGCKKMKKRISRANQVIGEQPRGVARDDSGGTPVWTMLLKGGRMFRASMLPGGIRLRGCHGVHNKFGLLSNRTATNGKNVTGKNSPINKKGT